MVHGQTYREDGADFYDRREARHAEHLASRSIATLQRLGYQAAVTPPNTASAATCNPDHPEEQTT